MQKRSMQALAGTALLCVTMAWSAAAQPEPFGTTPGDPDTRVGTRDMRDARLPDRNYSPSTELQSDRWSGGGGVGVIGSTPDGTGMALSTHADYFLDDETSIGPLGQFGFTGDMALIGVSGQAKRWFVLDGTQGRSRINVQGGLGFVHADIAANDTSWLIPVGVGYDHTLDSGMTLTATTLVNFTNLDVAGDDTNVMPSLMFGLRF
jgi:hypothetical protein